MALPTSTPTRSEVFALWEDRIRRRTHVCLPVEVLSYNNSAQTVTVKPQIQETFLDQNGVQQNEVLQAISGVPVQFSRGGSLRITFPVQQGDTGIIVVSDRSLDAWLALSAPADTAPADARRHELQDAIYIPGVNVAGDAWGAADPSCITIGSDTGSSDFVALASQVLTQLDNIVTAFNQHVHPTAASGPPSVPTPVPTVIPIPTPTSVASATVKVLG